ncbi:MAG: hypothetical protein WDA27_10235 [Actinomycetota bacterium]
MQPGEGEAMTFRAHGRPWVLLTLAVSMLVAGGVASAAPGEIATFAGGWTGDGSPAVKAVLRGPSGVAVAPDGSVFIADADTNRIRKVDPAGIMSTVAGNGSSGFSGDGGPATQAGLDPTDVAVAPDGSIFIADSGNDRIRKVDPDGTISTVAGNESCCFSGDGGPATQANLSYPRGVAVAPDGSIFIADYYNSRIRKVDPAGIISTVAGNGNGDFSGDGGPATQASLSYPRGVAVAPDGSIFIADSGNYRIRKVDPDGTISTVAGNGSSGFSGDGGPATQASLSEPEGVAVVPDGSIFIADSGNYRIRKVDPDGTISTVAGNGSCCSFSGDGGPAKQAGLYYPEGVAVAPDGSIFIADYNNHRIRKVDPSGKISTVAGGSWVGAVALESSLDRPQGVTVAPDGSTYIADTEDYRVLRIAPDGSAEVVAGNGLKCEYYSECKDGPATEAMLQDPTGIAVDPDGIPYIADGYRVLKVENGEISTVAGNGLGASTVVVDGSAATSVALHADDVVITDFGVLYISDSNADRIYKVVNGAISTIAGSVCLTTGLPTPVGDGIPASTSSLCDPRGLALGPDGSLYVADSGSNRIRKVDPDGTISTVAGSGTAGFSGDGAEAVVADVSHPQGVAVAPDGSIFIADTGNHCIRKVNPKGIITSVAGTGAQGFSGDGGSAIRAALSSPRTIALAPDGSFLIADTYNDRIRRVTPDTADRRGPTVGITPTLWYTSQSAITGEILDDDSGVATARVIFSPASGLARGHMLSGDELTCDSARTQCSFSISLAGLSPGVYDVSVTARDVAGNQGGATKKIVVVG